MKQPLAKSGGRGRSEHQCSGERAGIPDRTGKSKAPGSVLARSVIVIAHGHHSWEECGCPSPGAIYRTFNVVKTSQ